MRGHVFGGIEIIPIEIDWKRQGAVNARPKGLRHLKIIKFREHSGFASLLERYAEQARYRFFFEIERRRFTISVRANI